MSTSVDKHCFYCGCLATNLLVLVGKREYHICKDCTVDETPKDHFPVRAA